MPNKSGSQDQTHQGHPTHKVNGKMLRAKNPMFSSIRGLTPIAVT